MNPVYFGDSYDLVKRFFCRELSSIGFKVVVDPMLTGEWNGSERQFFHLICANPEETRTSDRTRNALFLDPDTGINEKGGGKHVSFERIAHESTNYDVVFAFDQSFSRNHNPQDVMRRKLGSLANRNCHGMYYNSHARFLFASKEKATIYEIRAHLLQIGLPESRLLQSDA